MKKIIISIVVVSGVLSIYGAIVSFCYNTIAWEYNLPRLNYWVITGTLFIINAIRKGISIDLKGED